MQSALSAIAIQRFFFLFCYHSEKYSTLFNDNFFFLEYVDVPTYLLLKSICHYF